MEDLKKFEILIVEDEKELCAALKQVLSKNHRCCVDTAFSVDQAFAAIDQKEYALILCDYKLGEERDGLDILFHAKAKNPHIITILMTGYGTATLATRAVAEGVYDYITKPFKSIMDVRNVVDRGLNYYSLLIRYNKKVKDATIQKELLKETLLKVKRTEEILDSLTE
ncbi:MAG: response regulator [Candidatus Omnitrophica bacterium]|nr:response regulator [Candidatus Omnitrophota bacterium]